MANSAVIANTNISDIRLGILGGGQLARMMLNQTQRWGIRTHVLCAGADEPAASMANVHTQGDITNPDDVLRFARTCTHLTVDIESVSVDGLGQAQAEGIRVAPSGDALALIQDKGHQRRVLHRANIPGPTFQCFDSLEELDASQRPTPYVQKSRIGGYDGRGVAIIKSDADLHLRLPGPCLVEQCVDIDQELSVLAVRTIDGEITAYPPVSMVFDPELNLVTAVHSPAPLEASLAQQAIDLACTTIEALDIVGIAAVELFLDKEGRLLVNEVAPRPHNSGHHTIDAAIASQYEQHLRAVLGWPLAPTELHSASVMLNILGQDGQSGATQVQVEDAFWKIPGAHLHLYGKAQSKPGRKMGHITVTAPTLEKAIVKSQHLQNMVRVGAGC